MKKLFKVLFILICLINFSAFAQEKENLNIRVDQIYYDQYPEMKAYVVIKNSKGEIVSGLSPSLFSFRVDSADVKVKSKIIPFSMTDKSVDYVIMVSNNGIMEGEPFDFQKNAILKFVELMNDNDTLSVYTIGEDAGVVCEDVNRKSFDSSIINDIELSDAQPRLYDSIVNLIRKVEQKKNKRKVIIILSDGRDQNSRFTKEQLEETLGNISIPIYSVGIRVLSNSTLSNLDEISQVTGGAYYYSASNKNIPDNLKKIIECCKQTYVVDLKVKNIKADNLPHILEVKVEEAESKGKALKTFKAVKLPFPKWLKILLIVLAVVFVVCVIVFIIVLRIQKRKSMGITKRKCPDCGNIMKDSWESCPFCRYKPELKKIKKDKKK